jgi:hypothetical protein
MSAILQIELRFPGTERNLFRYIYKNIKAQQTSSMGIEGFNSGDKVAGS